MIMLSQPSPQGDRRGQKARKTEDVIYLRHGKNIYFWGYGL